MDTMQTAAALEEPAMALPKPKPRTSVDEYLALERAAFERHLYLDGEVFAMAGESPAHADISSNLLALIGTQLRGTPCRARTKDTKVRSGLAPLSGHGTRGMFCYPDIVVLCGEPEYHDAHKDIVINPRMIIEVLSPSTEAFDRGEKFTRLQLCNPTLTDYVLVAQDQPQIEHYHRATDGEWTYRLHRGLDATVKLPSIGCTLKLAEVFERVTFADDD